MNEGKQNIGGSISKQNCMFYLSKTMKKVRKYREIQKRL